MSQFKVGDKVRITKEYAVSSLYHTFGDPEPLVVIDEGLMVFEPSDLELVKPAWAEDIPQEHWDELK